MSSPRPASDSSGARQVHRSGGMVGGLVGMAAVLGLLVLALVDDVGAAPWIVPLALGLALLIGAVVLRPAVVVDDVGVELRNAFTDIRVPYGRIASVTVRQFTVLEVETGERGGPRRRYACNGLGRSRRRIARDEAEENQRHDRRSLGALIEERIARRAREARSGEVVAAPLERRWARPVVVPLAVLAALTLVLSLVG